MAKKRHLPVRPGNGKHTGLSPLEQDVLPYPPFRPPSHTVLSQ